MKGTHREIAKRREITARLWDEGYSSAQIAQALSVSPTLTAQDLRIVRPGKKRRVTDPRRENPPPEEWRGEASKVLQAELPPADMVSRLIQIFCKELDEVNYQNTLAHIMLEAGEDGNEIAAQQVRAQVYRLSDRVRAMIRIVEDPDFRENMAVTDDGRADLRSGPRSLLEMDIIRQLEAGSTVNPDTLARKHNRRPDKVREVILRISRHMQASADG